MYKAMLAVVLSTVVFFVAAGSAEAAGVQSAYKRTSETEPVQTQWQTETKNSGDEQNLMLQVKNAFQNKFTYAYKVMSKVGAEE